MTAPSAAPLPNAKPTVAPPSLGRRIARRVRDVLLLSLVLAAGGLLVDGWSSFGAAPGGQRLVRMHDSEHWRDGSFQNPDPIRNKAGAMIEAMTSSSPLREPDPPLTPNPVEADRFATAPASGLRVTWLGHSTALIEIDGQVVLTDPIWSERVSPFRLLGPKRFYAPLIALDQLPRPDAVVISHDHYDHLDMRTIEQLRDWDTRFVVPLGVGAHLESWGVAPARISELDWWEEVQLGALKITATPARHASGRTLWDRNRTLWAGYALHGASHRVFFSGDTGLFRGMKQIGERLGPFDATLIEVGQYHGAWPDWHLGPEQAVTAHQWLRGHTMIPVHWGLVSLAPHGWTEPIERTVFAAVRAGVTLMTPAPGQSVEPTESFANERWWPNLEWQTAEQAPVNASQVDELPASRYGH